MNRILPLAAHRRPGLWAATALLASLLLACGGGGVEGQGTGTTPGFALGAISGFGSVIVNGVRFDDSSATVRDDEGRSLSRDDLKLGMVVRIDSGPIDRTALTAVASSIVLGSDLRGPVTANDPAAGTLVVLGQTVSLNTGTVLDERLVGGQAGIAVGSVVEVHALYDGLTGHYEARRIEPQVGAASYKIRGPVSAYDAASRSFQIGSERFTFAEGLAPVNMANGLTVQLTLQTARNGLGQWVVSRFGQAPAAPADGTEVEVESVIARYTSVADFSVAGLRVDASGARLEPANAVLAVGQRVEVEGLMRAGVLVASKVELKDRDDDGDDDNGSEFEIQGRITALDPVAKTLVIRGVTISYAGPVQYEGGTEADLAVNKRLEVKGVLSADGTLVVAEEIHFED